MAQMSVAQTQSRPPDERGPLRPSELFADRQFVVVGGTGFLGKVWVSMLLHRFPEIGHIFLLVRPKGAQDAEARFWAEVAPSEVFEPLRERYPGPAFEAFLQQKVTPVAGDIKKAQMGFEDDLVSRLTGEVAAVVNVAGVVDFNPPLDEALDVNAFGLTNLINLAKVLRAPVLHTSTCYVAGYRTGFIEEVDPRSVPFPRASGAPGTRLIAPPKEIPVHRKLDRSHWDPENEIRESMDVIEHTRHRCEDAFRQSLFLDDAKRNLERRGEPCRGSALRDELAEVKRKFTKDRLVEAGKERALYWGWPNIYTYTKSIGEQVLANSGVPYTIVRPAVIESASEYPFPSWNEGVNTSAPLLYMAMQGQVQFPGSDDAHLDIIPVDMVASAMLASMAELVEGSHCPTYQYGSTDTNGCSVSRFLELTGLYKRKRWQDGGDKGNRIANAILARFEPMALSKQRYEMHGAHALANAARGISGALKYASKGPLGPLASFLKPASKALEQFARTEDKVGDIMDLFLPFMVECDWVFSCENTRRALARMPAEERERFFWAPEKIEWRSWMFNVHMPGVERWSMPLIDERLSRRTKPLRRYDHLLDLLDEMAERHGHSVALRLLTDEGLTRTTFVEWREASASLAARLLAEGVKPGDRVMLAGENRPAWPIAYFGILRAGAIAVPVDPKLTGQQLHNIMRSADLRVAIWGAEVDAEGGAEARALNAALRVLDLDEMAVDDPSLTLPDVAVKPSDLASIIYTSGTTGDPKGVMLSHENFTSLLAGLMPIFKLNARDSVLSVLPLHHTFEFSCGLLLAMSAGATINYIGELNAERLGEGLNKGRISAMVGVPALWQMLERRVIKEAHARGPLQAKVFDYALELNRMLGKTAGLDAGKLFFGAVHDKLGGQVRYLISGGSALPKSTADTFAGLGLRLSEGYGLTEAAPVLTVSKASARSRTGQVGEAIPGVDVKIVDADKDGVGEVWARGPNVMVGYYGNDAATDEVIDEDGWLKTGDLGLLDKRGRLLLSGRSKDVIVSSSGENVYPDDVEDMLGNVEHIEELAIFGMMRGDSEVVACLARPKSSDEPRAVTQQRALAALSEACRKLPRHCRPTLVKLYEAELPKTATRKVKRSEVRIIIERLLAASQTPTNIAGKASAGALGNVQHAVAALSGRKPEQITPELSLAADLGFDSLMGMELVVSLEAQLGRAIDAQQFLRVETVADLVALAGASRELKSLAIEDDASDEPVQLPEPVVRGAKSVLTALQLGFYDKVMKPRVTGSAFIPHNRNTVVVSNHVSHLDMGFVKYALGDYGQNMVSLAAQDYFFKGRWRRTYFDQLTNLQAFDRKTHLRQALREACDTINSGKTVMLFPEGTRSTDGDIHEFRATLGHLALKCEVDVLPLYLDGTYESWPKGSRVPMRRQITAHIGPPLEIDQLHRLTGHLKFAAACRATAKLARQAVIALRRGGVLDLSQFATLDAALGETKEHPLVGLFRDLGGRYNSARIDKPITFYFSLGGEAEAKWTVRMSPDGCEIEQGKPAGLSADCVLKTTADIFTKMVTEAYLPTPVEVMQGLVKSNDVSLLATFQEAFDIR